MDNSFTTSYTEVNLLITDELGQDVTNLYKSFVSQADIDALASDDDATVTGASLRCSGWNQIWRRQDSLHGGLMEEALNFFEQNSRPY